MGNKKLIEKIEGQFKNHQCVKHVSDGSGESCTTSVECRCGEFCSKQGRGPGKCQPATCSLGNSGVCNAYPGFNHKFECRGDSCLPKQNLIKRAFRGQGPGNYEPEGLRQRPP